MRTKKVPCTTAAAGAPRTSFVSAVDEVLARTPPAYRIYPDTIWIYYSDTAFLDRYRP